MMAVPKEYSFTRYLEAKRSIDDRALNSAVWNTLAQALAKWPNEIPLTLFDLGGGVGTMLQRMIERSLLPDQVVYTLIDLSKENVDRAVEMLVEWMIKMGAKVERYPGEISAVWNGKQLSLRFLCEDIHSFAQRNSGLADLVVAHAFLDLLDLRRSLPEVLSLCVPGGLFYFTINYDGGTFFEPIIDPELDRLIENIYNQTMDDRITDGFPSGDSKTGRHLFRLLKDADTALLMAGSSDWVVFSGEAGYPNDEAYFLHFIIKTIDDALSSYPEIPSDAFRDWVKERHRQIERGELVYIAHQLDFVGKTGL